jgi:hypothetical protein
MTTTNKEVPKTLVVLGIGHITVHDLIGKTNAILTAMTGNTSFPSSTPTLATVTSDNTALSNAQSVALTKAKGAAADRNAKRSIVVSDLKLLAAYVQSVADANPADAISLIESAGMSVRKPSTRQPKQDLALKPGKVSGVVEVAAKAQGPRASHEWQWSADGKTWTTLPTTLQAKTSIAGLTPGSTIYVRHAVVTKTGVSDFGQVVSMMVH